MPDVRLRPWAAALAVFIVATAGVACGDGGGSFPEPRPCPPRTPLPTTSAGAPTVGAYYTTIRTSVERMASIKDSFRVHYPNGKFYRSNEFRLDFAAYADETICLATAVQELIQPNPSLAQLDQLVDQAMTDIIDHTQAGREAVRSRNVTDYRTWDKGVDAKIESARQLIRRGSALQ